MTTQKRDYYDILELAKDASDEDIKRAFRKKAMQYHPDRNKEPNAVDRFKEINEAYQVLSDTNQRARYDQFGHSGIEGRSAGGGFDGYDNAGGFGDIFDAFFGGSGGRGGQARSQQGADVHLRMNISLSEAAFGTTKEVPISRAEFCSECNGTKAAPGSSSQTCNNCRGSGQVRRVQNSLFGQFAQVVTCAICQGAGATISDKCKSCRGQGRQAADRTLEVKIPKGIETGHRLRLSHEGHVGTAKGLSGDAYIEVVVEPDTTFTREGDNLIYYLPLNIAEATLGVKVDIPTLEGKPRPVEIPAGTQPNSKFRIKNAGVNRLQRTGRGDLIVIAVLGVPDNLTSQQRSLMEELLVSFEEDDMDEHGSGWLNKVRDTFNGQQDN
jgi:molecular chaperone DnaJ